MSLEVIAFGLVCRFIGSLIAGMERKFNWKERFFMACAWTPKATVQAALGGMALAELQILGVTDETYMKWANSMVTTAVLAICITAPLGAILINTLGKKWLHYDGP